MTAHRVARELASHLIGSTLAFNSEPVRTTNTEDLVKQPLPKPVSDRRTRVAITCTGVGRVNRGFETLARELFDHLHNDLTLDVRLFKGGGPSTKVERRIPNIHRGSLMNRAICAIIGKHRRFWLEYLSFCAVLAAFVIIDRPAVIYVLEAPIYKFLLRWRKLARAKFRLIFTTGGQLVRIPAASGTLIHHVTPYFVPRASELGFPSERQVVIPQFIDMRLVPQIAGARERNSIRARLRLPTDRKVVLSVGSLDRSVKRMDYVIREVARLEDRPYLVLLGQPDHETSGIESLAATLLTDDGYRITSVPRRDVWDYYRAADAFTLASLMEGFGFVYVEALAAGLPVIAHDFPISRWVLGQHGTFADLEQPGALARELSLILSKAEGDEVRAARRAFVTARYDWQVLRDDYVAMFEQAASEHYS